MDFNAKKEQALALLAQTSIPPGSYRPLLIRLLWSLGVEVPPPHFMRFSRLALLSGVYFGVAWGLVMGAMYWARPGGSVRATAVGASVAGLFFGLCMAIHYGRARDKHGLPRWESLG
ncbi:MAG: DUF6404 family protein [Telluria sp.]